MRVLLIDLLEGPGHAYYTGSMARALAAQPGLELGVLTHSRHEAKHFAGAKALCQANILTGLEWRQAQRALTQGIQGLRLLQFKRRFAPELIHFVFPHPYHGLLSSLWSDCPQVATWHDVHSHPGEESRILDWATRQSHDQARGLFVHGPGALALAQKSAPEPWKPKLRALPHPGFTHFPLLPAPPVTPPQFLFFGRMAAYKGLPLAVSAFERVLAKGHSARLAVAGHGALGLSDSQLRVVREHGEVINDWLTEAQLQSLMARSFAVLLPYLQASASGVCATAAGFGRSCIMADWPGLTDMVELDESAWSFPSGDVDALTALMVRAIENPRRLIEMGLKARKRAETVNSWPAVAKQLVQSYRAFID